MIVFSIASWVEAQNETAKAITDPFEDDEDLRFAADTFCREYTLGNPRGSRISIPYKPDCRFWWQCTTYQLKKHECQGGNHGLVLHYDLYLDLCEMESKEKPIRCSYAFDEEEIIMEQIMGYYKKQPARQ